VHADEISVGVQSSTSSAVAASTLVEAGEDGGIEGEVGEDEWAAAQVAEPDNANDAIEVRVTTREVCGIDGTAAIEVEDEAKGEPVNGTKTDRGGANGANEAGRAEDV
jgi:hypothetical protein